MAPIVLFVYNRIEHLKKTINALQKNIHANESDLIIFSDGAKNAEDLNKIQEIRNYLKSISGFYKIKIIERDNNLGLAKSIITGLNDTFLSYDKIIILEDDIITDKYFLTFMNEALLKYRDVSNIYSVTGFMYPIESNERKSIFLPLTSSWGWGTWKEKWCIFDYQMTGKENIQNNIILKNKFNLADEDFAGMLNFGNNSWAIRWYYSVFIRNGLGVFPTQSLITNTGFDNSGTNCNNNNSKYSSILKNKPIDLATNIVIDLNYYSKIINHLTYVPPPLYKRIFKKLLIWK
ncbi:MAG: glycosyltransferase [Bacteroidota bacterium]|nr:glycosyltransferase [Bacteroidota bacterium]